MMKRMMTLGAALSLLGGAALAQSATKIRGTVVSLDGSALHLKDGGGQDATVALSADYKVMAVVPAKLADVTPGSYIGAAAETGPDGNLTAKEIHTFPKPCAARARAIAPSTSGRRAP